MLKRLYLKYREIISYLIVGGLTTLVSLGVYYGCVFTVCDPDIAWQLQAANMISWIAAVTFAYFTNRRYVFRSQNKNKKKEAASFYISRITTLVMDMVCMFLMVTVAGISDKLAKLIVQIIVMAANYLLSKFLVFTRKERYPK